MYEIILWENKKLSAEAESYYNIDSEINESDIYDIDNMSLDEKKEKTKWHKRVFESELENTYETKIHNCMTCIHVN